MFKYILAILYILFALTCKGEYLSWPYKTPRPKSELWKLSYNLRTVRPIMESAERMGVTFSEVYGDSPKYVNFVDLNARVPVLRSLDFTCRYRKGDEYPTKVSLCWSHLEIAAFHICDDMKATGGSVAILLPFFASTGFIVNFGLTQSGHQFKDVFDGVCGITFLLWQEERRLRLVWINAQSEGAVEGVWSNPVYEPDVFKVETGFARGISFVRTILATEVEWKRGENLSRIKPMCKLGLETLPFKGFFVGLEGKIRRGEKSWGAGIYLDPEYWR